MIVVGGEALVDLVDDRGSRRAIAGGGPFNTAVALGRLDVSVGFLGAVSRDAYGEILIRLLLDAGVDTSLARRSELPTPQATVHRSDDGRNAYTFSLGATAFTDFSADLVPPLPESAFRYEEVRMLPTSCSAERPRSSRGARARSVTSAARAMASASGKTRRTSPRSSIRGSRSTVASARRLAGSLPGSGARTCSMRGTAPSARSRPTPSCRAHRSSRSSRRVARSRSSPG